MVSAENRIESFYKQRLSPLKSKEFLRFDPDNPFVYLTAPNPRGISLLIERTRTDELIRRVAMQIFEVAKHRPLLLRHLPNVSLTRLYVPSSAGFDFAISSPRRITLLSPETGKVSRIGWKDSSNIQDEISIRGEVSDLVNVPSILEANSEFPYLVTEYISGEDVENPVQDWSHILSALCQLCDWNEKCGVDWIGSEDVISDLRGRLETSIEKTPIRRAFHLLDRSPLPEKLAYGRIHADLHGKNIRVTDGKVFLLDWEHAQKDYLLLDFLAPFIHWEQSGVSSEIFLEMYEQRGKGGEIASAYASEIGPMIWGSTDWYPNLLLIGLLLREPSRQNSGHEYVYRQLAKITGTS